MTSKKVDLFIFGAPKCGTTAMVDYLGQHPSVFFPNIKEPHFFCTDFDAFRRIRSGQEYADLYPFDNEEIKVFGDASVWYLYSKNAAKNVFDYNPNAKIVVMLRNPVEMLPSLHTQLIFSGRENIQSFDAAWQHVEKRKIGHALPPHVIEPSHLYYDEVCKYFEQISRLYEFFPKESCKIIFFEDFKRDPQLCTREILAFVGLKEDYKLEVSVVNKARKHRYPWLSSFIRNPPFPLSLIKRALKSIPIIKKTTPLRGLYSIMSTDADKVTLSPETEAAIRGVYSDDVEKLAKMANKDLSMWKMTREI